RARVSACRRTRRSPPSRGSPPRSSARRRSGSWRLRGPIRWLPAGASGRKKAPIVAPDAILGREQELADIARFFDGDPTTPRALLIEGQAGIGKTTLWREAVKL